LGEHERAEEIAGSERSDIVNLRDSDEILIADVLMNRSAMEWEALFNRAHVPAAKVRSLHETLQEEQLKYRGVLQSTNRQTDGNPSLFPVTAFSYAHGTPSVDSAPPTLGQHTKEVLLEAGLTDAQVQQLKDDGVV